MAGLVILFFLILGTVLVLIAVRNAIVHASRIAAWSALGFISGGIILWHSAPQFADQGDRAIFQFRFIRDRPIYEETVSHVMQRDSIENRGKFKGVTYEVDRGIPVRVAFPQPGGILDNWEGVVYDPSDAVDSAQGWTGDGQFTAPMVRYLFGGDLVAYEPIEGHYHRCWFT